MSLSRAAIGNSWKKDSDKPFYHVMPRDGWLYVSYMPLRGNAPSVAEISLLGFEPKKQWRQ